MLHLRNLGSVTESGLGYFAVAKEVEGINFTRSTEQQQEISNISELGTRRVKKCFSFT